MSEKQVGSRTLTQPGISTLQGRTVKNTRDKIGRQIRAKGD
jgi:hypothetical protein